MLPVYFIPHGGGPCFFMDWTMGPADTWNKLQAYLESIPAALPEKPAAILVITAHWEERNFTLSAKARPGMFYDYEGFPEHTYQLQYNAPGDPALAESIAIKLNASGIDCKTDSDRDFDHGVFVPLMVMFPQADIPVVMMSLKAGLNPEEHIAVGKLLYDLRSQGILIIGSGLNYHNMRGFMQTSALDDSRNFNLWLKESIALPGEKRNITLANWEKAPAAKECHPREEHLLPLMVCSGAAGNDAGKLDFSDIIMNSEMCAYKFG